MTANWDSAKKKAKEILNEFNLIEPPIDPEAIARAKGIGVVYADFKPNFKKRYQDLFSLIHYKSL